MLKDTYNCFPDFQPDFIQALHDGNFLHDREESPSNFSIFLCPCLNPLSAGDRQCTTILQIKNKQGKGWTDQDYSDAVKQGISTPDNINLANHQLRIWWGCSCFFMGDSSTLPTALAELMQLISFHSITFEARQLNNKLFFAKLFYQLDTRVFIWL